MWEHGHLEYELGEPDDMTEDAWVFKWFDGSAVGPKEEFREPSLNVIMFLIGKSRWEMVAWHQGDTYWGQEFYFKRRYEQGQLD